MEKLIFTQALKMIADTISTFDSYKSSAGINISNWATQLFSNDDLHYPVELTLVVKDNKPLKVNIPVEFQPVTKSPNATTGYIGDLRNGQIPDSITETMLLMGYFTAGMILGKIPSVVNSGRGLIVEKLIRELSITDLTLVIKGYSSGGTNPPHDLIYTFPQIKSLLKFFSIRANEIEKLEKKGGHTSGRVSQTLKRDNIKVEILD